MDSRKKIGTLLRRRMSRLADAEKWGGEYKDVPDRHVTW
jgi:hypothetical protein